MCVFEHGGLKNGRTQWYRSALFLPTAFAPSANNANAVLMFTMATNDMEWRIQED
jgi:hypothetical protein